MEKMYNVFKNWQDGELAPLYCQYGGQNTAQDAFLEIDCDKKEISFSYDHEVGNAVPVDVWNHRTIRIGINNCVSSDLLDEIVEDEEFVGLVNAILSGYECVYNGNNYVGRFDNNANEAIENLESYFEWYEDCGQLTEVYEADDWLNDILKPLDTNGNRCDWTDAVKFSILLFDEPKIISKDTSDDEIKELAETFEFYARTDRVVVLDIEEYLQSLKDICTANDDM